MWVEDDNAPKSFDVSVSYLHPQLARRFEDVFHIDLMDYHFTLDSGTALEQQTKQLKKSLNDLAREVKTLNQGLKSLQPIANPTGLNLSVSTLQSLQNLLQGKAVLKKRNPRYCGYRVFQEILEVDFDLAFRLAKYDWDSMEPSLTEIEGMTNDLVDDLHLYFIIPDKED